MAERVRRRRQPAALLLALPAVAVAGGLVLWPLLQAAWPLLALVVPPRALDGVAPPPSTTVFEIGWLHALGRQAAFSFLVLAFELPLGLLLALALPRRGAAAGVAAALVGWPLLVPQAVADLVRVEGVPRAWDAVARAVSAWLPSPCSAPPWLVEWSGYVLVDVWRWTPFVALVVGYALRLGDGLDRAAIVDGTTAWQRLRLVHWPRARGALALAAVLRLVDSFAAWPQPGSLVSLAAWVRDRSTAGPGPVTAVATGMTLLVLLIVPAQPLRTGNGGAR